MRSSVRHLFVPGISRSSPLLRAWSMLYVPNLKQGQVTPLNRSRCTHQSLIVSPSNFHSSRNISCKIRLFSDKWVPFTRLYLKDCQRVCKRDVVLYLRCHESPRLCIFLCNHEGHQVHLAHGALTQNAIGCKSVVLFIVAPERTSVNAIHLYNQTKKNIHEMFDGSADTSGLKTLDECRRNHTR